MEVEAVTAKPTVLAAVRAGVERVERETEMVIAAALEAAVVVAAEAGAEATVQDQACSALCSSKLSRCSPRAVTSSPGEKVCYVRSLSVCVATGSPHAACSQPVGDLS
jgi:hypothetical protein